MQFVFHPCLTLFEVFFIGYSYVDVRVLGRMRPGEADRHYKIYSIISNEIRLLEKSLLIIKIESYAHRLHAYRTVVMS